MNDETRIHIGERIAQLEQERDQYIQQANQQIAAYNGALGELRRLLDMQHQPGEQEPGQEQHDQ